MKNNIDFAWEVSTFRDPGRAAGQGRGSPLSLLRVNIYTYIPQQRGGFRERYALFGILALLAGRQNENSIDFDREV